jgi:hypothetical protein
VSSKPAAPPPSPMSSCRDDRLRFHFLHHRYPAFIRVRPSAERQQGIAKGFARDHHKPWEGLIKFEDRKNCARPSSLSPCGDRLTRFFTSSRCWSKRARG